MSRTTIYIKDELIEDLKALAAIKQVSVSELLAEMVEKAIASNHTAITAYREQLKAIQAKLRK